MLAGQLQDPLMFTALVVNRAANSGRCTLTGRRVQKGLLASDGTENTTHNRGTKRHTQYSTLLTPAPQNLRLWTAGSAVRV